MKVDLDIDDREIKKALNDLGAWQVLKRSALEAAVNETALNIERGAKKRVPVNFGRLRSNIRVAKTGGESLSQVAAQALGLPSRVVITDLEYSAAVEHGSKPHWVPIRPLKLWAKRKLKDEGAAYAVQKAIAERGTKEQPYLFPAAEEERPKFVARIKEVLK